MLDSGGEELEIAYGSPATLAQRPVFERAAKAGIVVVAVEPQSGGRLKLAGICSSSLLSEDSAVVWPRAVRRRWRRTLPDHPALPPPAARAGGADIARAISR
jgi:hypothetical protein